VPAGYVALGSGDLPEAPLLILAVPRPSEALFVRVTLAEGVTRLNTGGL